MWHGKSFVSWFLNSNGVIALAPVCVWFENFQRWGHCALCLLGRRFPFFRPTLPSFCLFYSFEISIMTAAICLFHSVALVEISSFQMFPCGLPILLRAGEFPSPIDSYSHCYPDTKTFWEQFPSSQLTAPLQQQNDYVFHALVMLLFSLPFSLTGQFRKGSPVRVFRWWWGSVSARVLLLGKIHT